MKDHIAYKLINQHQEIGELIDGLDERSLHLRIQGKWSIAENIAHLGRYQEVFSERLESILKGDCPSIDRYVAEEDANFLKWQTSDLWSSITLLNKDRTALANSILSYSKTDVKTKGEHPTFGKLSLTEWVKFFLYHESHHLYQIFRLKHQIMAIDN